MLKKLLFVTCLLALSNCSAPGTALLGPAFTGAKTGSVYQASLSYGTGQIMNEFTELNINSLFEKKINKLSNNFYVKNIPDILSTYAVNKVEISEVIEPEPLP